MSEARKCCDCVHIKNYVGYEENSQCQKTGKWIYPGGGGVDFFGENLAINCEFYTEAAS